VSSYYESLIVSCGAKQYTPAQNLSGILH
jgi:hypothetical protein